MDTPFGRVGVYVSVIAVLNTNDHLRTLHITNFISSSSSNFRADTRRRGRINWINFYRLISEEPKDEYEQRFQGAYRSARQREEENPLR
jgi:hypothetical protein